MAAVQREPVRAPELNGAVWLNTDHPISLSELRGKLVLLDVCTMQNSNNPNLFYQFGLMRDDYKPKPVFETYRRSVAELGTPG